MYSFNKTPNQSNIFASILTSTVKRASYFKNVCARTRKLYEGNTLGEKSSQKVTA